MKNKLKVYRAMHDLSQIQLSEQLGISRQTVIAIEKNRHKLSLELAYKIANYFDVNVEDIFPNDLKRKE
ncbi:helix-turn-helix transcriptional regulator [Shouchella clausii]|jgi:putative transcriptional regulator|uniref:helix-turn-helix transcriptional regulator n=1 Tax=Shouchella clausii TaxID=79880 RepID=UPI000BA56929|nr:helix-turn-helix transcriptional regulator [Shouchella clausii]MBU8597450.1 helix-turn-helix transcriptional regulator [Shouchella clausii]MCY1105112.1 helix-turn-helix transcriptional regulator [Shouchella clausii]MDO7267067.1 helix-turn-helix transcriptional regulator [Shouchella clausii]MDO7286018.1 helix-turn-helix transcriptional regulator [Shouchella clausii]MEB5478958.1 helix-turn-helix transcriptional regulator [Shouchella clausii]